MLDKARSFDVNAAALNDSLDTRVERKNSESDWWCAGRRGWWCCTSACRRSALVLAQYAK